MSFELDTDQQEFKSTVERFLKDFVTSEYRRKRMDAPYSADASFWDSIAELGFQEYFSEDGTLTDLAILAELSGVVLLPEPLIERLFAGPYLGKLVGDYAQHADKISTVCCVVDDSVSKASFSGSIEGVLGASAANRLVCLGPSLSDVRALNLEDKNVTVSSVKSLDLLADLAVVSCDKSLFSQVDAKNEQLALQYRLLKAVELSGICRAAVAMTKEYVETRKQFGKAIGSFQAVRHKLADMYVASEALDALCLFAVWAAQHSPAQFTLASLSAIDYACEHTSEVVETAIQLHGGIGFTWEFDLHLFLRRAKSYEALFGLASSEIDLLLQSASSS